ncbi:unnamed protein product [Cylicocyclus nassatus]|uniref:Kinase n=1 Tax=Cylicocyclus nassatus TaxID=53992 RepID=A0AA36H2F4_CYLNA|nr:unnamed protein product [Cylicocyclus nassatus]
MRLNGLTVPWNILYRSFNVVFLHKQPRNRRYFDILLMEVPEQELPPSYEWFSEQIAGHHPSVIKNGKREIGILKKNGSDKVLKPKQDGLRGECEVNVYKLVERALRHGTSGEVDYDGRVEKPRGWENVREEDLKGLIELTPAFYGITTLSIDKEDHEFMILEDITVHYKRPAILDIKMGKITYDPFANKEKREKESGKYPPQKILGFRLLGYRMHRNNGEVIVKDKEWGKAHDEHNVLDGLHEFFSGRGTDPAVTSQVLEKMDRVRKWFAAQKSFQFYASSLLFVYENDPSLPSNVQIVMIDFSHVFPSNDKYDVNYIHGLETLYSKLQALHDSFLASSKQSH